MKDLNADMGLENTVSLYALGEESVDETDETSDVWYTQVNFAYLTDVTDEICVREIRFSELPELQMQENAGDSPVSGTVCASSPGCYAFD